MELHVMFLFVCILLIAIYVKGDVRVERTLDKPDHVQGLPCHNRIYLKQIKDPNKGGCMCSENAGTFYMNPNKTQILCSNFKSMLSRDQNGLHQKIKYHIVSKLDVAILLCDKSRGELEYIKDLRVWDFQDTHRILQGTTGIVSWRNHSEVETRFPYEKEDFQIKFLSRKSWYGQIIKLVWKCKNENKTLGLLKFTGYTNYPLIKMNIKTSSPKQFLKNVSRVASFTPAPQLDSINHSTINSLANLMIAIVIVMVIFIIINVIIYFLGKRRRRQTLQSDVMQKLTLTEVQDETKEPEKVPFELNVRLSLVYD